MAVVVTIRWEQDILHVATLPEGRGFCLGEWPADFVLGRPLLGVERLDLVSWESRGPRVQLPAVARSAYLRHGRQGRVAADQAYRVSAEPRTVLLSSGEAVTFDVGAFRIEVAYDGEAGDRFRGVAGQQRLGGIAALRQGAIAALVVVCQLTFLAAAAYAIPPVRNAAASRLPSRAIELHSGARFVNAQAVMELGPPPPLLTNDETLSPYEVTGVDCRCKCTGPKHIGDPEPVDDGGRYAVQGPQDNPDPHIARHDGPYLEWPYDFLFEQRAPDGDPLAPTMPWGRDTSLGVDDDSAKGSMFAPAIGSSPGSDEVPPPRFEGGLQKVLTFEEVAPLPGARPTKPPTERPRRVHFRPKLRWQDLEYRARSNAAGGAVYWPGCSGS